MVGEEMSLIEISIGRGMRRPGEESDADSYRDSSSDRSSDCKLERGFKYSRDWSKNCIERNSALRMNRLSLREKDVTLQGRLSREDCETGNSQGYLLFEFHEQNPPYSRKPLSDKVLDLARHFPELRTFRSSDLSSASWIPVAWYPIYCVPTGSALKDLDACFLTFHSLSTPITGIGAYGPTISYSQGADGIPMISLPIFGLASDKFKDSIWIHSGVYEGQLASSLQSISGIRYGLAVVYPKDSLSTCHFLICVALVSMSSLHSSKKLLNLLSLFFPM